MENGWHKGKSCFFVTVYQVDYSHFSFVIFVRLAKILHIGNKNTKKK